MAEHPDEQLAELVPDTVAGARSAEDLALLLRMLRRREARRRDGAPLTYRQLAARARCSHSVIAAYFTGKILPPTDRFDALIRLLGANAAEQGALATTRDRVEELRRGAPPSPPTPPGTRSPVPHQLPADAPQFIGRSTELAKLDALLEEGSRMPAVVVSAISGTAGIGKTALAVHWAHQVRDRFPDGTLYVDLHGYGHGPPTEPARVLDRLLADLGLPPTAVPAGLDAKAARYRSLLDGRRVLVVLDNAADPQQVRPLLPGSVGCAVVITSRSMLTGLAARDRARRILLDVLPISEAVGLLASFVGTDRVAAESPAAQEFASLCACLPVALCVAGERAAARPEVTLAALVAEITAGTALDLLDADGDPHTAVRAVFAWSYDELDAGAANLFRLLGLHPGHDFDRYAAAALVGGDLAGTGHLLDELVAVNLVQQHRPGRYRMHDLLRAYAAERAGDAGSAAARRAMLARLFDFYDAATMAAMIVLFPSEQAPRPSAGQIPAFHAPAEARAWLDAERSNLVAVIRYGSEHGWATEVCAIAESMSRYLYTGNHRDALEIHGGALRAARGVGDRRAEATALVNLGRVLMAVGSPGEAIERYEEGLAIFRETGDRLGEGTTLRRLGVVHRVQGRHPEAFEHFGKALNVFGYVGDPIEEANTLGALSECHAEVGEYQQASDNLARCLKIARELGDVVGEGNALGSLGYVDLGWGRYQEACDHFEAAHAVIAKIGNQRVLARNHNGWGEASGALGRPSEAMTHFQAALRCARAAGDLFERASALDRIAGLLSSAGDRTNARRHWLEALAIYDQVQVPEAEQVRHRLSDLDREEERN